VNLKSKRALWPHALALALVYAADNVNARCDWEDFPVMSTMTLAPVLGNTTHNRQQIIAKEFRTPDSKDSLERYYWRRWQAPIPSALPPWEQLSLMTDTGCLMTVQYQPTDTGTTGRLIMSNFAQSSSMPALGQSLVMPDDAIVASDTIMDDGVKSGRVVILASAMTPDEVSRFYMRQLRSEGWALEHEWNQDETHVMVFRDGPALYNVLITPAADFTQILINTEEPN